MFRLFSLIIIYSLFSAGLAGQGVVTFEAETSSPKVVRGSVFELTFTLSNADPEDFQPPDFGEFQVISGPSRSLRTTIINGAANRETTWSYTLLAGKTGQFSIPAATVRPDGNMLRSEPVVIEVVPAPESDPSNGSDFFLEAWLSDSVAYPGQQILLDYKIYTLKNIESFTILMESDYSGFYAQEVQQFDGRIHQEKLRGNVYYTKIIKRVALFPQQNGWLEIDPLSVQVGISAENRDPRRSFFFFRDVRYENVTSPAQNVRVKAVPTPGPEGYSGAVGDFRMDISVRPDSPEVGEAVSIRFSVSGNGDIRRILPPELSLPAGFQAYDPKIILENTKENGGQLIATRTFEYLAIPSEPGTFNLQPQFACFRPDPAQFLQLAPDSLILNIRQSVPMAGSALADQETGADIRGEDRPAERDMGHNYSGTLLKSLAFGLLLFSILYLFFRKKQTGDLSATSPETGARKYIRQVRELEDQASSLECKAVCQEISLIMTNYLSQRFGFTRTELGALSISSTLERNQVPEELRREITALYQTCQQVIYAGIPFKGEARELAGRARRLIHQLEDSASSQA